MNKLKAMVTHGPLPEIPEPPRYETLLTRWTAGLGALIGAALVVSHFVGDGWRPVTWSDFATFLLFMFPAFVAPAAMLGAMVGMGLGHVACYLVPGYRDHQRAVEAAKAARKAEEARREQLARQTLEFWQSLVGRGVPFEREVARLFQEMGHEVRTTPTTGDGGIDLWIGTMPAQCKAYGGRVGVGAVREFAAVIRDKGQDGGILAALNGVTAGAAKYAKERGIRVIDAAGLTALQLSVSGAKEKEP